MRFLPFAVLASLVLGSATYAQDGTNDLAVDPGSDFVVEAIPPAPPYTSNFGVKSASGTPANFDGEAWLCQVSFAPAPQNAELSQTEINDMVTSPEWLQLAKDSMAPVFTFEDDTGFKLGDFNGHEFVAVPKQPGAENVRLVLSMLETAKGRTAISCVADETTLEDTLPVFRQIRDAVTPPA